MRRARRKNIWRNKGYKAGLQDAPDSWPAEVSNPKKEINQYWSKWILAKKIKKMPWQTYHKVASGYLEGFCQKIGIQPDNWVLLPTGKTVGAIISVMNEETSIQHVIEQLNRLALDEIIVIVNGSTDYSFEKIRSLSPAVIVHYKSPLGYDVGRAIGAKMSTSEVILFLDGDIPIVAEDLVPFIYAIEKGYDVALNNLSPYISIFAQRDSVTMMKEFLNRALSRPDLAANSLTAVPHALSRKAIETIGHKNLIVPPKAQVLAVAKGLKIGSPIHVDVITKNRVRAKNTGETNPVSKMIIGDHIEALAEAIKLSGSRLHFSDRIRSRVIVGGEKV